MEAVFIVSPKDVWEVNEAGGDKCIVLIRIDVCYLVNKDINRWGSWGFFSAGEAQGWDFRAGRGPRARAFLPSVEETALERVRGLSGDTPSSPGSFSVLSNYEWPTHTESHLLAKMSKIVPCKAILENSQEGYKIQRSSEIPVALQWTTQKPLEYNQYVLIWRWTNKWVGQKMDHD
jgi:hypothetical protein